MATNENLPPNVIKQLAKELKNLDETPPEGIKVGVDDDNFSTIYADIDGPAGTPYENGVFRMKLILSHDFPHTPPKGYFLTKIFHPNIATNGEICVNALKRDWNPSLGLRHVLMVIRCLLIEPFPESALNEQAGKMLLENYDEYARHARIYTGIHALKSKPKAKTGAISEVKTTALNVDQSNTSVHNNNNNVDQKNAGLGGGVPLQVQVVAQQQQPMAAAASSNTTTTTITGKVGSNNDHPQQQSADLSSTTTTTTETAGNNNNNNIAPKTAAGLMQKKSVLPAKVPADKKRIDARKKSLKRL